MTEALNRGWGGRDSSAFMLLEEERSGVEIAVKADELRELVAEREGR
jgi:3-hydroxyisobutyrate dehydrogenase